MTKSDYESVEHTAAEAAYAAYGKTTDYKNYQGLPMPKWEDLGQKIQQAWINAADAVAEMYY